MKNKKAQGHIEVIVSFSIFMIFIVFLFIIFNPLEKPVNPEAVEGVFTNLADNLGSELEKAYIRTDNVLPFIVEDVSGLDLCDGGIVVKLDTAPFYYVYCSEKIKKTTSPVLAEDAYTVEYVTSKISWSEEEIIDFHNVYCNDYKTLKDKYVLPANDFAVVIYESNGAVFYDMRRGAGGCDNPPPIPTSLDVFSRVYPIETFDEGADIKQRRMQIIVW